MNSDDYVECVVEYKAHTDKAVLVAQNGNEVWVPRSLLKYRCDKEVEKLERGAHWDMEIREWFADKEGLEIY